MGGPSLQASSSFLKILFIHLTKTQLTQAGGMAEGEGEAGSSLSREPDMGLDPRTPQASLAAFPSCAWEPFPCLFTATWVSGKGEGEAIFFFAFLKSECRFHFSNLFLFFPSNSLFLSLGGWQRERENLKQAPHSAQSLMWRPEVMSLIS